MNLEDKQRLKNILLKNLDIFAWKHENMVDIDPKVRNHCLSVDPKFTFHGKKRRALNPKDMKP